MNKPEASELTSSVISLISKTGDLLTDKNDQGLSSIDQALNFLKQMADFAKKQEIDYFLGLKDLPKKLHDKLSDITNKNNFDYFSFINLINEYYSGLSNYQQLLKYEQTRLATLNDFFKEFRRLSKKGKKKYSEYIDKDGKKNTLNFYDAFNEFLKSKASKNIFAREALETQTFANKIQSILEKNFNFLWQSFTTKTEFINLIENNKNLQLKEEEAHALFLEILTKVAHSSIKEINDLKRQDIKINGQIIDQFLFSFNLEGEEEEERNSLLFSNKQRLEGIIQEILKTQQDREKITNRLFLKDEQTKIIERLAAPKASSSDKRKNDTIIGLGTEAIALFNQILDEQGVKKSNLKGSERTKLIDRVKEQIRQNTSLNVKNKKDIPASKVVEFLKAQARGKKVLTIKTSTNDNWVSEMNASQGLASSSTVIKSSLIFNNRKADAAAISLPAGDVFIIPGLPSDFFQIVSGFITDYFFSSFNQNDISPVFNSKIEKEFKKEMNFSPGEFSLEAETLRRI